MVYDNIALVDKGGGIMAQVQMKMTRRYVEVFERHHADGSFAPRAILWGDGTYLFIDRCEQTRAPASPDSEGSVILYQIDHEGKPFNLFFDECDNAYYVEVPSDDSMTDCR